MKKLFFSWLLSIIFLSTAFAQYSTERTGYEGDYFSLEGALDLFKQSRTLSDFERKLNTEENWVNNLDLNYDGRIDYIRVEHRREGNYHAVILQAVLHRRDIQDVAVIEIEVTGRREAILQIVGDEDLYGQEVIVEPVEGYSDSRRAYDSNDNDYVNVYYWQPVQYILGQQYHVYVSPYRWQYYPTWWSPWAQCNWNVFRPRIVIYHNHYHVVHRHRVILVHNFYRPYRSYSYDVVQRSNQVRISHGKPPVHRPAPAVQQDRIPGDNRRNDNVVERSSMPTRSSTPEQRPSVSRKSTMSSSDQNTTRSRNTGVRQRSDSSVNSPETPRSARPDPRPVITNRKTTPSYDQPESRTTTPRVNEPSRNTTPRSTGSTRMSPTPPKTDRNTAPTSVHQPSRNPTPRSSTTTRSTSPTQQQKPAVGSSRSTPAAKSETSRNTTPKRSSSQSGSRSRGGGF